MVRLRLITIMYFVISINCFVNIFINVRLTVVLDEAKCFQIATSANRRRVPKTKQTST